MEKVKLGRTGLVVPRNGFGALPIQRIPLDAAVRLIHRALDGGMYYFDTARFYTDSEEKLGVALEGRRSEVIISTKTGATTAEGFWKDLETSLRLLRTDYVDLYQFHNPSFCPKPGDGTGLYEAMQEAVRQGKVRHIGITNHRQRVAIEAIESGLYETLQYPFSYLASEADHDIVRRTLEADMGFICMNGFHLHERAERRPHYPFGHGLRLACAVRGGAHLGHTERERAGRMAFVSGQSADVDRRDARPD